ncbi:MAG: hypothetical protein A3H43_03830 [Gammaproteobacteria bacterium RIFCSPLOWO2_02_FULL_42_9]|nr:MAG: hypothetical protein A3H43_03830 [Gammaproteobacteria bacterium RIFCSPLOWO2_02_FULL_42_9]
MIQSESFELSKRKARLAHGEGGFGSFVYFSDVSNQWEKFHANSKLLELMGSQSMPLYNLSDVQSYLGELSAGEKDFSNKFTAFYRKLAKFLTTVKQPVLNQYDLFETLLDMRLLKKHVNFPSRVLDIGPGGGRHLVNMALNPEVKNSLYVGIESIGLPYILQNSAASMISSQNESVNFLEYMDYEFERKTFPEIKDCPDGSIVHLPLWESERLPEKHFDLILCNYVLDEVSPADFQRISNIIGKCLSDDGVVYCRGGQQRAGLKGLFLFGQGDYHGADITKTLLSKELKTVESEVIASQLVRFFARKESKKQTKIAGKYTDFVEDAPLLAAIHSDYIAQNVSEISQSGKSILVWGESGYDFFAKYFAEHKDQLNIIGFSNRQLEVKSETSFGITEYPVSSFDELSPDVVIIASGMEKSILNQIRGMSSPGEFEYVQKFNHPISFVHRKV